MRTPILMTTLLCRAASWRAVCGLTFGLLLAAGNILGQSAPSPDLPAAQTNPSEAASPVTLTQSELSQAAQERTVQLEPVYVSAAIGTYHETTSSMASKVPTNTMDLASSLEILNHNAITDRNANTLQDIFAYVGGVNQTQTNINGFTFRGLPVSGSFLQNIEFDGLMGTPLKKSAQSAANVYELEYLKGPNTVLYGQMHPGGLMNIVSKSPEDKQSTELRVSAFTYDGAFKTFGDVNGGGMSIDATGPIDSGHHWLYRVIGDLESTPPSRPGDFDRLASVFSMLTYRANDRTEFTIKLESDQDYRRQDDGLFPIFTSPIIPTPQGTASAAYGAGARYYFPPFNTVYQNTYDFGRDKGEALSTFFRTEIGEWTFRLQTRSVWHQDLTQEDTQNSTSIFVLPTGVKITPKPAYAVPQSLISRQYNDILNGHRWNFFDANVFGTIGPDKFKNTIVVGMGGGTEQFDNQRLGFGPNVTPVVTIFNPIINQPYTNGLRYPANGSATQHVINRSTSMGYYATDQARILNRLHVSYGIRADQYVQTGIDLLNPVKTPYQWEIVRAVDEQLGLVFDLTPELAFYSSWSQSTTPNTVTAINAQGRSGFPPEAGEQFENGFKFEAPDNSLSASICYFFISRTNVLVLSGQTLPVTGQGIFRVDGAQHSEGAELEVEWHPIPNLQVQIEADVMKAFVATSAQNPYTQGDDLAGAPRTSGTFWGRYNFTFPQLKGFGLGLGVINVGKQWVGDPTTVTYFVLPGWTRVDAALYYRWHRYAFALNVQNVGDRRYIQSAQSAEYLVPGEQRKLTFSFDTKF